MTGLVVRAGEVRVVIPADAVVEVLRLGPVTRLPHAPAGVAGLVSVRGRVTAVVDPQAFLGPGAHAPAARHGVLLADGPVIAVLAVDAVEAVERFDAEVRPLPTSAVDPRGVLAGQTQDGAGVPVAVLDVAGLLRVPPPAAILR